MSTFQVHNFPTCQKCSNNNQGEFLIGTKGCFGCGNSFYRLKEFPCAKQGQGEKLRGSFNNCKSINGHRTQQVASSCTCGGKHKNMLYDLMANQDQNIVLMFSLVGYISSI